jgi:hypothetical protein
LDEKIKKTNKGSKIKIFLRMLGTNFKEVFDSSISFKLLKSKNILLNLILVIKAIIKDITNKQK